jgi:hypothetical protein
LGIVRPGLWLLLLLLLLFFFIVFFIFFFQSDWIRRADGCSFRKIGLAMGIPDELPECLFGPDGCRLLLFLLLWLLPPPVHSLPLPPQLFRDIIRIVTSGSSRAIFVFVVTAAVGHLDLDCWFVDFVVCCLLIVVAGVVAGKEASGSKKYARADTSGSGETSE